MRFDSFCRPSAASALNPAVPPTLRVLTVSLLLALAGQGIPRAVAAPSEPLVAVARPASVPEPLREAQPLGRLAAGTRLTVALALPWRNSDALETLIHQLNDPADPLYKKFLTHAQFVARFAPTEADYAALESWAKANGLSVVGTTPSRSLLIVSGSRDAVEAGFHVQLNRYRLATGRVVYANDAAPELPQSIAARVASVVGLTDYPQRHPDYVLKDFSGPRANPLVAGEVGTGPGGGLTPADIRSVYNINPLYAPSPGPGLDGTGQTIALYEQNGYDPADIAAYAKAYGLPAPNLTNITIGAYSGAVTDPGTQGEVTLDIELVLAVAPKANILVYEFDSKSTDPNVNGVVLLTKIADDDRAQVVSESYGLAEEDADFGQERIPESIVFQKMMAQGQSMLASSGDNAAYLQIQSDPIAPTAYQISVSDPASQPLVTAVGGTTLPTAPIVGGVATYGSETTWFTSGLPVTTAAPTPTGGGGGESKFWTKPDYQAGQGASATMRDLPDVSLDADPNTGYSIFLASQGPLSLNGVTGFDIVGGTSASCPLWAAFLVLVNQQRQIDSLPPIGFANPNIYTAAEGPNYGADFHDINDGSTNGVYKAGFGFDDCTGWGSFIAANLLPEFAPAAFGASPISVLVVDANNNPVPNANITVITPQVPNFRVPAFTDAKGTATVTVPIGIHNFAQTGQDAILSYIVSADLPGFAGTSQAGVTSATAMPVTLRILPSDHTYPTGGLQMISSPFDYSTVGDFSVLFGLTPPLGTTHGGPDLYAYAPALTSYLTYPTAPADTLRLGQGYWAILPANAYVRRKGTPAPTGQSFRINLLPGWNMVGDPFLQAVPISSISVDTVTPGTPVPIGSASTVQMPFYNYNGSAYQTLGGGDSLQPFQGYWIHATQPAELVIPNR